MCGWGRTGHPYIASTDAMTYIYTRYLLFVLVYIERYSLRRVCDMCANPFTPAKCEMRCGPTKVNAEMANRDHTTAENSQNASGDNNHKCIVHGHSNAVH